MPMAPLGTPWVNPRAELWHDRPPGGEAMGPLTGIRIIDLTSMLSGPWATMILGDQGADVIKVEMPGQGDHTRAGGNRSNGMAASFLNLNRNKRSIAIDLKTADGVALVKRLAASAD